MCLLHNSTIIITSELLGPFQGFICYLFVYAFLYISSVFICLINNNFLFLFLRVLPTLSAGVQLVFACRSNLLKWICFHKRNFPLGSQTKQAKSTSWLINLPGNQPLTKPCFSSLNVISQGFCFILLCLLLCSIVTLCGLSQDTPKCWMKVSNFS